MARVGGIMGYRISLLFLLAFSPLASATDLIAVFQTALEKDPQLHASAARVDAQRYVKKQKGAAFLPSINFNAEYAQNEFDNFTPADFDSHSYSINLNQTIYRQSLIAEYQISKNQFSEISDQHEYTKQNLIIRLSQQYFALLAAFDNLEFAEAETTAVKRQLDQVKKRFDVGAIAITDVQESRARFDLTVAQKIEAENNVLLQKEALREITGEYYETLNRLNDKVELEIPIPDNVDHWVDMAIKNSPLLGAAEAKLAQAKAAVGLARAGHIPNVDFVARYQKVDNPGFSSIERSETSFSIELNAPIFQSGLTHYKVQEAQKQFISAQQEFERSRREILKNTRGAFLNVKAAISRVTALEQALISSQTALAATKAGFNAGTRSSVDILDSQRELFRAKRDYSRARYDYIINKLLLKLQAGVLAEKDLHTINQWLTEKKS